MVLREHFVRSGNWLFSRRSYLPLVLLLGVVLPALIVSGRAGAAARPGLLWSGLCLAVALAGLAVRVAVVGYAPAGTSGRVTRAPEADALNTSGLYSVVQHPLYVGNYLMWLGASLFPAVWWCPVIITLVFWLYYERIAFAEEEFLRERFGDTWREWAERTPAFLPALARWRAPGRPFSLRTALKREYSALFGTVATFTFMDGAANAARGARPWPHPPWIVLFFATGVVYLVLRTLKHKTRWLDVRDR